MTELPIDDDTLDEWLDDLEKKKSRIRVQSEDVATYIKSTNAFYDWFDEQEGFHYREERFWDDCETGDKETLFEWVRAAFHMGFEAGRSIRD